MKKIHPKYAEATVTCACGYSFKTRSTQPNIRIDICSHCHPFFTGHQKLVDTAGRVEKFRERYRKTGGKTVRKKVKKVAKKTTLKTKKIKKMKVIKETKETKKKNR